MLHTSESLSGWKWVSVPEFRQDLFNLTSNRCWCLGEAGRGMKHLCVSFSDLRIQEAGFHWQRGFEKSNQVLAEKKVCLTRNRLQIFPHVKQMNNRVVLINQSSSKPSADGNNELLFHGFLQQKEMFLTEMHSSSISSTDTRQGIRTSNQIKTK